MQIDFDLRVTCIITPLGILKHSCPAVTAAEVTVIGEDKVKVQENLIIMGFPRR